ncbi:MAG: hypothetical protein Kow00127_00690 [Bacteroidales bacterium]
MKKFRYLILMLASVFLLTGCLTTEKKEYRFELSENGSGTLTIKYINIMSMMEDSVMVADQDFESLVQDYINGDELDMEFENAQIRSKRLFEENGVLCGEVVIDFQDLKSIGLYQYDSKSPYMFHIGAVLSGETYLGSNGEFGGDNMPVVFWPRNEKVLELTTYITAPDESTVSLLPQYKKWE